MLLAAIAFIIYLQIIKIQYYVMQYRLQWVRSPHYFLIVSIWMLYSDWNTWLQSLLIQTPEGNIDPWSARYKKNILDRNSFTSDPHIGRICRRLFQRVWKWMIVAKTKHWNILKVCNPLRGKWLVQDRPKDLRGWGKIYNSTHLRHNIFKCYIKSLW